MSHVHKPQKTILPHPDIERCECGSTRVHGGQWSPSSMVEYTTDGECKGIVAALRSNQKQKKEINTKALFTVEFTTSQDMSGAVKTAYIAAKDLYTALSAAREIPEVGSVIGIKCSYPEKEVLVVW